MYLLYSHLRRTIAQMMSHPNASWKFNKNLILNKIRKRISRIVNSYSKSAIYESAQMTSVIDGIPTCCTYDPPVEIRNANDRADWSPMRYI